MATVTQRELPQWLLAAVAAVAAIVALLITARVVGCPPTPLREEQPLVSAPAPRLSAGHSDGENLFLVDIVTVFVPFQVKVMVKNGDTIRERVVTEYRPVFKMRTSRYALREVKAYGTDGRLIDARNLPERLAKQIPVLVSADGRPADPLYLQAIKDNTLILVLPPPKASEPSKKGPEKISAPREEKTA